MIPITEETVRAAVCGGALLGGGGGGDPVDGESLGSLAFAVGDPVLLELNDLDDEASVVTVSAVGAPAAKERCLKPIHYVRALELLKTYGIRTDGLITCENGGLATVNGWFQSAVLGIPVIDAPANGRAHPIGVMGSMGLHKIDGYESVQTAAGGSREKGLYTETSVKAGLVEAAKLIRQASISAGGLVGVARNPVTVQYARENAAVGAIGQAIDLGRTMLEGGSDPSSILERAAKYLSGDVVAEGEVTAVRLETRGGLDVGIVTVSEGAAAYELTFWNEYMSLEKEDKRIGTFPDLIATFDMKQGQSLPTAAIRKGQHVAILHVGKDKLKLGSGMKDPQLYAPVEEAIGKPVVSFVFPKEQ
jgi:DUF917 family protein